LTLDVANSVEITPIEELGWPPESADFSPLVHTIETTDSEPPFWLKNAGKSYSNPRLEQFTALVYDAVDKGKKESRGDKIRTCRTGHWFMRHEDTRETELWTSSCHAKWCPKDVRARANYYAHNTAVWCESFNKPIMLVLTMKHSPAPLAEQYKRFVDCFRRLRRCKEFRKYVRGGIWGWHILMSYTDGFWHLHLHAIIDADWYPQKKLSRKWFEITGDSDVVWLQYIDDPIKAAYDVAGYAACPCNFNELSLEDAVTVVETFERKRMCGTWGSARGVPLRPGKRLDKEKWHNVGSLTVVIAFYNQDPNARAIADSYHDHTPLEEGVNMCRLDAFIDDAPGADWNECWSSDGDTKARSPPREDPSLW
jgi:hypothetical protein